MHILILNWRDIRNPQAGGAEQLTYEIAKRWVEWGHKVTQISAVFPGGKRKENIDGIKIIRLGRWWNVHFLAFFYYFLKLRRDIDIIIDEVHWFPFFARLYAKNKTVLLVCEVANNLFYKLFPWSIAAWGRVVEKFYLWLYKNTPTMAISPSTKQDLVNEGFDEENVTVLPMGVSLPADIEKYRKLPKEKNPTLIYLGRINKQKGAEDALSAFKIVKRKIPDARLWLVGEGKKNYVDRLKQEIDNGTMKQWDNDIQFFGYVSEEEKFELLARAHILIVPSIHEGWGLVVPEANAVGTPAIVYNVAGLKNVVEDGMNGAVVDQKPENMAKAAVSLLQDRKKLEQLSRQTIKEVNKYSWDKTAKTALSIL